MTPERLQEGFFSAYKEFFSGWSILTRALQPMGRTAFYWAINLIWRRYVTNWLDGIRRDTLPQQELGHI
jgi:hypothetical protein